MARLEDLRKQLNPAFINAGFRRTRNAWSLRGENVVNCALQRSQYGSLCWLDVEVIAEPSADGFGPKISFRCECLDDEYREFVLHMLDIDNLHLWCKPVEDVFVEKILQPIAALADMGKLRAAYSARLWGRCLITQEFRDKMDSILPAAR